MPVGLLLLLLATTLAAQPQPFTRIALRFGTAQVLIIGGDFQPVNPNAAPDFSAFTRLPAISDSAAFQPGEDIYPLAPQRPAAALKAVPETNWRVGDRWSVFTGSGRPVRVVIRKLVAVLYCGGLGGYSAAIADIQNQEQASWIAGLRVGEYLAMPGPVPPPISAIPLVPVAAYSGKERTDLLRSLMLSDVPGLREKKNLIHPEPQLRYSRWRRQRGAPLLFVEALWFDKDGQKPRWISTAVVDEGTELKVVASAVRPAGPLLPVDWAAEPSAFRNAWQMGERVFVLCYAVGEEGFSVGLRELIPGKGLAKARIAFAAGC